jgi:hypothetical protein
MGTDMCYFFSWILFCIVPVGIELRRIVLSTDGKDLSPIPSRDVGRILRLLQRLKREES